MQIVPIEKTVPDSRQHACKSDFLWRDCAETVLKNVVRFDPSIDASRIDLSKTYTSEFVERAMKKYGSGQFSDDHHGFRISRLFPEGRCRHGLQCPDI